MFTRLDLLPTDEADRQGRPIWIVENSNGGSFRYFQSAPNWQLEATIPAGYRTNFASTPRAVWRVIPPDGTHRNAAILHDWLYDSGVCSRWLADALFFEAMRERGVPLWRAAVMWLAVRCFAGRAYQGSKR